MSLVRDMLNRTESSSTRQDARFLHANDDKHAQPTRPRAQHVAVKGGYFLDGLRDVMSIDVVFADITSRAYDRQNNQAFEQSLTTAMRNRTNLNANLLIVYERRTANGKYVRSSEMLPCQIRPSDIRTESGKALNDFRSFTIIRENNSQNLYYGFDDVNADHVTLIFDLNTYRKHTMLTNALKYAYQTQKSQQAFMNENTK